MFIAFPGVWEKQIKLKNINFYNNYVYIGIYYTYYIKVENGLQFRVHINHR